MLVSLAWRGRNLLAYCLKYFETNWKSIWCSRLLPKPILRIPKEQRRMWWRGGNDDVETDYRFVWPGPTVTWRNLRIRDFHRNMRTAVTPFPFPRHRLCSTNVPLLKHSADSLRNPSTRFLSFVPCLLFVLYINLRFLLGVPQLELIWIHRVLSLRSRDSLRDFAGYLSRQRWS